MLSFLCKIVKNNNADHKKTVKEKLLFYNNIKPKKIIDEKTLKKIEEKINSKIVFNHNSKSEKNFSFSSYFYKIANNSNNDIDIECFIDKKYIEKIVIFTLNFYFCPD